MRAAFFILIIVFCGLSAAAQLKLPSVIDDHMVLQRDKANKIWGWNTVGKTVSVEFRKKKYTSVAGNDGGWSITLPAYRAGITGNILITSGKESRMIQDVIFGEVWVCSGQSNMEWKMNQLPADYPAEKIFCKNDRIRFVVIQKAFDNKEDRNTELEKKWSLMDSSSLGDCSAVAYYFAKKLNARLQVPVGLIVSSWGGTFAQSWMDTTSLREFPHYYDIYKKELSKINFSDMSKLEAKVWDDFRNDAASGNAIFRESLSSNYNDKDWKEITIPGIWEGYGYPELDGLAAYRISFDLSSIDEAKQAVLHLPAIDDIDSTFINGVFVGSMNIWNELRVYNIPAGVLKKGKNVMNIWVQDNQGGGGFNMDPKNFYLQQGDQKFTFGDKAKFKVIAKIKGITEHVPLVGIQNEPSVLFASMIAPLLNYSIRGAIWYQGESNVPSYVEYRRLFPAMINCWRRRWKQGAFPFLFTQLSSYNPGVVEPKESDWAGLREAQAMALRLPNTGMAVTIDVGDRFDIHPLHKKEVGERLALNAFRKVYGFNKEIYSGPCFLVSRKHLNTIRVSFTNTGSGLMIKGNKLVGFAIAGRDKNFVPAEAKISGDEVIVSSAAVKEPMYVRYAWANAPLESNLFNKEGLPAAPFRTDRD